MPPVKRTLIFADIEAAANAEQGQLGPYVSSYEKVVMPSWSQDDAPDAQMKQLASQLPGGDKLSKSQLAAYHHILNGTYGPNVTVLGLDQALIDRVEQMKRDPSQREKLKSVNMAPLPRGAALDTYVDDAGNTRKKENFNAEPMMEALLRDGALTRDAEVARNPKELNSLFGTSIYFKDGAQTGFLGRKPSSDRDVERVLTHSWIDEWRHQPTYEDRNMFGNPTSPEYEPRSKALGNNPGVERAILSGSMSLDEGITKAQQLDTNLNNNKRKDKAMELLGQDKSAMVAQERARQAEIEKQRMAQSTVKRSWWQRMFSRSSSTPAPKKVEAPKKSGKKTQEIGEL